MLWDDRGDSGPWKGDMGHKRRSMCSHRAEWRGLPNKSEEGNCGKKDGDAPGNDTSRILTSKYLGDISPHGRSPCGTHTEKGSRAQRACRSALWRQAGGRQGPERSRQALINGGTAFILTLSRVLRYCAINFTTFPFLAHYGQW